MMAAPFFIVAVALIATLAGKRGIGIGFWLLGLIALLFLFRLHATDPLALQF